MSGRESAISPHELVETGLAASRSDDAILVVRESSSANLRWANNTLTTNGVSHGISVTAIAFQRRPDGVATGSASGSAASADQVRTLMAAADRAARAATVAEDEQPLLEDRASSAWQEPSEVTDIAVFGDFAPALGEACEQAAAADRLLYGFVSHEVETTYLASTTGLRLRHVQPTGHWGCTAKPSDLSQSAWVGGATRDFRDVDPLRMADELTQRLAWGARRVELPAGRYDTVLPPSAVADLMIDAYWGAGARVAHDGQSVYSRRGGGTRIGEHLARPGVTLSSDPSYGGLEAVPFVVATASGDTRSVFDNGLPLESTAWIEGGRLDALVQTRHSARLTGRPATPMIDNLTLRVDEGRGATEDLVAGVQRGLLLTCLWYIRQVDPQTMLLTGLTRDGVYLIEDGEVTAAVNNFRFNDSPVDLLQRFTQSSATVPSFGREWGDYFSRTATPALRVPDFHMSSVSQAQ
jgi:predicted Zn-dependent protease